MPDIYTIDFESMYDTDYSLSKMQTEAYVEDARFETIGMGIGKNDGNIHWFTDPSDITHVLDRINWDNCAVRAHNTHFDGLILSHRYGKNPAQWRDTLASGRMMRPYYRQHSLAYMAKALGLPDKGNEVIAAKGKRRVDFTPAELHAYGEYCKLDTALCRTIGDIFDPYTPPLYEYLIDMTVRMFTEPALVGNRQKMQELYQAELDRKAKLLIDASVDRSIIMSGDKLARALLDLGVVAPRKVSPKTGKETWAFAKTDKVFCDLLEHEDPQVQALVAARLGVKSTIAETRAKTYAEMTDRGPLRVFLAMWGAKTTGRYSGTNKANWQNLPARGPAAGLREAICAPVGHQLVVGDSSNIELRTVMCLAGQWDVVEKIRNGVDLYCDFASRLFGRTITKADKAERQLGKVAMLSLQYGAGAPRFQEMVRMECTRNADLSPITIERAMEIVALYRQIHHKVVDLWNHCNDVVLPAIARGDFGRSVDVNGWFIVQNEGFGRPGEPGVMYHDLRYDAKEREWTYQMGNERVRIFGPKVVENLSQHAAMIIVMWQTARINTKFPVKLSVHDEAVTVPEDARVAEAKAYMLECLSLAPAWCRGVIPVAGEVGVGTTYSGAK